MRKIALFVFCLLNILQVSAQIMPATPQPATFHPVALQGAALNNSPSSLSNTRPNTGTGVYDADKQRQTQIHQDYADALEDINQAFGRPQIQYHLPSHRSATGAASYLQAYGELNAMLEGKAPVSLKRAVFLVENAYFGNSLSYESYSKRITALATFCRLRMEKEHTDTNNNAALNDVLFRFMSDTLTVKNPKTGKEVTHYPIHYDFEDFYGNEDWTKMFVTKLINTNFGQCHSMPLLYGILAEELGAKAYISASPSHLFIKYPKGNSFQNVELTNGHRTTDAYVMASGYIKAEAIRNKLYLDTLSNVQAIALMMQDLGKGYYVKFGFDDFVEQCANTGLQYYPNDPYGMAIKSDYNTVLFQYVVSQMGRKTPNQVLAIPEARKLYDNMLAMYKKLDDSGYAQMPEDAYEDWLQSIDKEKRKQERELFLKYQRTHKNFVPNGRN